MSKRQVRLDDRGCGEISAEHRASDLLNPLVVFKRINFRTRISSPPLLKVAVNYLIHIPINHNGNPTTPT